MFPLVIDILPYMTPSLRCPTCNRSLGQVLKDGTLKAICSGCRTSYAAVYGRLSQWHSEVQPVLYLGTGLPSWFRRRYEFRIATPGRSLKLLKFSVPGREDSVPVGPGDRLSVLYATRGDRLDKLVAIYNHTLGRVYRQTVYSAELSTPDLRLENPAEARLVREIQMVRQKQNLQLRIEELRQDGEEGRSLLKRLHQFRSKILAVSPTLYATRIASLEAALRLVQQRLHYEQRLIEEYQQTIQMIDIELEAASFEEKLPMDDLTRQIFQRIDELKALEVENQDFQWLLEANEEVRRLSLQP